MHSPNSDPRPLVEQGLRTSIRGMTEQIQDFLHDNIAGTDDPEMRRACVNLALIETDGILAVIDWLETWRPVAELRRERIIP